MYDPASPFWKDEKLDEDEKNFSVKLSTPEMQVLLVLRCIDEHFLPSQVRLKGTAAKQFTVEKKETGTKIKLIMKDEKNEDLEKNFPAPPPKHHKRHGGGGSKAKRQEKRKNKGVNC